MSFRPLAIPWTASTNLDLHLARAQQSAAGIKKSRQVLRSRLAPQQTISLGRRGTVSLDNAALLPCLQTASRWGNEAAFALTEAYREAGVERLAKSRVYEDALQSTKAAIQRSARAAPASEGLGAVLVQDVLIGLMETDGVVREVAEEMHEIHCRVAEERSELREYGGHLVRVEGPEALVVVDLGDREALRAYDASYLKAQGIDAPGEAFILQEIQWSPDTLVSAFIPAYDPEAGVLLRLERKLADHERPLSELPQHLITGVTPRSEASGETSEPDMSASSQEVGDSSDVAAVAEGAAVGTSS